MDEHAQDILDGSVCEECFNWFGDVQQGAAPPGHPRKCRSCKRGGRGRKSKPRVGAALAFAASSKGGEDNND